MKILVRNISKTVTEESLKEMFEAFGQVQYCTLILDSETGKHKGFGFVEMPKVGEAKAAITNLNNTQLEEKRIRVKRAIPKEQQLSPNETDDK